MTADTRAGLSWLRILEGRVRAGLGAWGDVPWVMEGWVGKSTGWRGRGNMLFISYELVEMRGGGGGGGG